MATKAEQSRAAPANAAKAKREENCHSQNNIRYILNNFDTGKILHMWQASLTPNGVSALCNNPPAVNTVAFRPQIRLATHFLHLFSLFGRARKHPVMPLASFVEPQRQAEASTTPRQRGSPCPCSSPLGHAAAWSPTLGSNSLIRTGYSLDIDLEFIDYSSAWTQS